MIIFLLATLLAVAAGTAAFLRGRRLDSQTLPTSDLHGALQIKRTTLSLALPVLLGATLLYLAFITRTSTADVREYPGSTMIVIDVSGSIDDRANEMIGNVLDSFNRFPSDRRAGIVFFSTTANVGAPLTTSAHDIASYGRFFETWNLPAFGGYYNPTLPTTQASPWALMNGNYGQAPIGDTSDGRNPWAGAFDGGTEISAGLAVARRAFISNRIKNGRVILISDLQDDTADLHRLQYQLHLLKQEGRDLVIMPLPNTRYFSNQVANLSLPYRTVFGNNIVVMNPKLAASAGRPLAASGSTLGSKHHLLVLLGALALSFLLIVTSLALPLLSWEGRR